MKFETMFCSASYNLPSKTKELKRLTSKLKINSSDPFPSKVDYQSSSVQINEDSDETSLYEELFEEEEEFDGNKKSRNLLNEDDLESKLEDFFNSEAAFYSTDMINGEISLICLHMPKIKMPRHTKPLSLNDLWRKTREGNEDDEFNSSLGLGDLFQDDALHDTVLAESTLTQSSGVFQRNDVHDMGPEESTLTKSLGMESSDLVDAFIAKSKLPIRTERQFSTKGKETMDSLPDHLKSFLTGCAYVHTLRYASLGPNDSMWPFSTDVA